ncbi:hypothetical protein CEY12_14950 [Chryseobacterium sp. T16E-39]|uniref:hypothetical protein n=1 Tax=Chryseobacterium sp. T16E-39 TaxID=2015076 RepID=UPI000B5B18B3|nr:hypothetical protein [Chryseobacterium sp. T16E-39]ASK31321.1 hypothetical protein CEY12_14950 [Chryseobacterium sp. T16E-39]
MKNNFNYFKMYRRFFNFVFLSIFTALILTSCSQDNLNEDPVAPAPESGNLKTLGSLTLQKDVIILDDESVSAISNLNNQNITFTRSTDQTDDIKAGSVLVGTKVEGDQIKTILSKVTSVTKTNNQYFVQTSSAKLEEFIYSGTLSGVYDPSGKAPIDVNGKMVNYIPVEGFISQELNNKIINIESKNLSNQKLITFNRFTFDKTFPLSQQVGPVALASSVNVKGGVTPKIDYNISFSWGHLTDFSVNFIMDDIRLQSTADIQASVGYTVSTTDFINIPIAPIVLGPTGLILSPTISAGPFAGVSATGKAKVNLLDVGGTANFLVSKNPALNISLEKKSDVSITSLEGILSAEVGLEAKGAVGLQFLTVPIANSGLRGRASAISSLGVQLIPQRKGILDVKAKIQADMFYGFGVFPLRVEGTIPLFQKEFPIYHKEVAF